MSLLVKNYSFQLPDELIAQEPSKERTQSKLLLVKKVEGKLHLEDRFFYELPQIIDENPSLGKMPWVRNRTRVFPARFFVKRASGSKHEVVLVQKISSGTWKTLIKKEAKIKIKEPLEVLGTQTSVKMIEKGVIRFPEGVNEIELLEGVGQMPLPPYILNQDEARDRDRYQSVWAEKHDESLSAAAPTASLHFSEKLTEELAQKINFLDLSLDVGLGTFAPVRTDDFLEHAIHEEAFHVPAETSQRLQSEENCLCVGTTAMRALESLPFQGRERAEVSLQYDDMKNIHALTKLYIHPGFEFFRSKALLTNFHLPESTLFLLLCTFWENKEEVQRVYAHAVEKKYRFFSYGDATLWVL